MDKEIHKLLPGEVSFDKRSQAWFIGCPSNSGIDGDIGNLAAHDVTYDDAAKVITVSPSILCSCGAHYFVEHNQIRWCS
jgi:hypothetical protein